MRPLQRSRQSTWRFIPWPRSFSGPELALTIEAYAATAELSWWLHVYDTEEALAARLEAGGHIVQRRNSYTAVNLVLSPSADRSATIISVLGQVDAVAALVLSVPNGATVWADSSPRTVDVGFDVTTDAGGGDPDLTSATLRAFHQLLWSKPLPDGRVLTLDRMRSGAYLFHESELGTFYLASDGIGGPAYDRSYTKQMRGIVAQFDAAEIAALRQTYLTIGGFIVFPGNKVDGRATINGARGLDRRIADRIDLTLACIRGYYLGDDNPYTNPLADALARYADFFDLFTDFAGYTQYFLLQDLADPVTGAIDFRLPFHGFDDHNHTAFPRSRDEYSAYSAKAIAFVEARNRRIAAWAAEHLST